jgi:putrescine aminotransferase
MGERQGPRLYDYGSPSSSPHCLYNLHCNGGVFNVGHRNEEIISELTNSLKEVDIGNHHLISRSRAELALALSQVMPGDLRWVIFGVSGGEAIDLAVKICWGYTKRRRILVAHGMI